MSMKVMIVISHWSKAEGPKACRPCKESKAAELPEDLARACAGPQLIAALHSRFQGSGLLGGGRPAFAYGVWQRAPDGTLCSWKPPKTPNGSKIMNKACEAILLETCLL